MQYAIWNNKGGVGKSFLTFVFATEYALKNPSQKVCVIDMCPQANVSEIILGGNGRGQENLANLLRHTQDKTRKTIGGYFDIKLSNSHGKTGSEATYALPVKERFKINEIPENLLLVCGDPSLELQVQSINQMASIPLPKDRWGNVHRWVIDLRDGISSNHNNVVYFIDCNPSFATYTAQAILASKRLIVPCTADGASARAIDNIGQLVYGEKVLDLYKESNFSKKAKDHDLAVPKIHLVLLNRHTTSQNRPSKAFQAMYEEIKQRVKKFENKNILLNDNTEEIFKEIPDAHAVAITASEKATPISSLKSRSYDLQHGKTQINPEPLNKYKEAIEGVIPLLS